LLLPLIESNLPGEQEIMKRTESGTFQSLKMHRFGLLMIAACAVLGGGLLAGCNSTPEDTSKPGDTKMTDKKMDDKKTGDSKMGDSKMDDKTK
jgi:hypothetical protein